MQAYVHDVPGRLRIKSPLFKIAAALAEAERAMSATKGVTGVQARRLTGSLLVHYDETKTSAESLKTALLRDCGVDCGKAASLALDDRVERFCHGAGEKIRRAGADMLVDAALKSAGLSFLSVLL